MRRFVTHFKAGVRVRARVLMLMLARALMLMLARARVRLRALMLMLARARVRLRALMLAAGGWMAAGWGMTFSGQIPLHSPSSERDSTGWTPIDRGMFARWHLQYGDSLPSHGPFRSRWREGPWLDFSSDRAVLRVVPIIDVAWGRSLGDGGPDTAPASENGPYWNNTRGARFEGWVDGRWILGGELMERQAVAMPFWQEGLEGARSLPGWGRIKWRPVEDASGADTGLRMLDVGRTRGWIGWMQQPDGTGWGFDAGIDVLSRHLGENGYLGCVQEAPAPYFRVVWGGRAAGPADGQGAAPADSQGAEPDGGGRAGAWHWEGVAARTTGLRRQVLGATTEPLYTPQGRYGLHGTWRPGGGWVVRVGAGHLRMFRGRDGERGLHRSWGGAEVQWHRGGWRFFGQGGVNIDPVLNGIRASWRPEASGLGRDGEGEGEPVAVALGGGAGFEWSGRDYRFRAEWNVQPRDATREGPDWLAWSHAGLPLGPFPGDGRQTLRASADAQWLRETRLPLRLHLAHLRLLPLPGSAPGEPAPAPEPLPVPGLALTGHLTEATLSLHPSGRGFGGRDSQRPGRDSERPGRDSERPGRGTFAPWGSPSFTLWAMGGQPDAPGNPATGSPVTLGWQVAFQLYVPLP
ncbi:MAG: hypothetical protein RJA19_1197 [Bacteroidota bacterium]